MFSTSTWNAETTVEGCSACAEPGIVIHLPHPANRRTKGLRTVPFCVLYLISCFCPFFSYLLFLTVSEISNYGHRHIRD